MICPICGTQMPKKARKCGKCGCRPKYLYGYPKPPMWIFAVAAVLLLSIVAGIVFLPSLVPKEEAFYDMSLRLTACSALGYGTEYTYDEQGNLRETRLSKPQYSSSINVDIRMRFLYDEQGVFVGFERTGEGGETFYYIGTVSYEEPNMVKMVTQFNGKEERTVTFYFDDKNRIKEYIWGDVIALRTQLKYDDDGRLYQYIVSQKEENDSWRKLRTETFNYTADGMVSDYTREHINEGIKEKFFCYNDQQGNVVKEKGNAYMWSEKTYTYDRKIVSARTARQYEMQLHLIFALGLSSDAIIHPIVKTPVKQGE